MKIISWNVNGIRAVVRKECFFEYLQEHEPDILFLQETKAWPEQLPEEVLQPLSYHAEWVGAEKKGYSGVAIITKTKPLNIITEIGVPEFDSEGRVVGAEFEDKVIFGVYFPNSQREGRLDYKLRFCDAFFALCDTYKKQGKHVIVTGDYNTAHTEIDLARPKENVNNAGFLPEERAYFDKILNEFGYVDVFREAHPGEEGHYSWWTFRAGARQRNIGWRIDYALVSKGLESQVKEAFIQPQVKGSDHCPVGITLAS
jgi:exodeoxyribonuclease-3